MFERFTLLQKLFYIMTKSSQERHTLKFQFSDWEIKHNFFDQFKTFISGPQSTGWVYLYTNDKTHTTISVNISFFFRNIVDHKEDVKTQKLFYNNLQLFRIYQTSI